MSSWPMWPLWVVLALIVLALAGYASLWSAGRFAKRKRGPQATSLPRGEDAALDRLLAPLEQTHAGQTGIAMIESPYEALKIRLAMTQMAERSLDLLYYMWEDDLSGRFLAQAILEAADRGVRVRLLLDDVQFLNKDPVYRALDRHMHIEVRIFNPIRNRDRGLRRGLEMIFTLLPYNRRMHGKMWAADARLAVTGGRNIGDEYFDLLTDPGLNYEDLDTLLAGEVMQDAQALFDQFWNSGLALPIRTLWPGKRSRLQRFRSRLTQYLAKPKTRARLHRLQLHKPEEAADVLPLAKLRWSADVQFLGDPPEKAIGERLDDWMPDLLTPLLRDAQHSVRLMTPYFVPGAQGLEALISMARRGLEVEVITNGLAVSDNVLVHGAYRWYRQRLLAAGVRIFEVSAQEKPFRTLHSKAMLVDGTHGFVGSFNFDLRSAFMNTEMGVVFTDPALIADLTRIFDGCRAPHRAYALAQSGRRAVWSRGTAPGTTTEPQSNRIERSVSFVIGMLPIHRFL
ncbi:phospholipase D-like domain-containing protein [Pararhodobacter oceanensis]|uniref:phospholipase D-like domain-containing protein n=1 Tax=Pararhodobacter oceanensis TaxID=2172121 RepID=UPI003A8FAA20